MKLAWGLALVVLISGAGASGQDLPRGNRLQEVGAKSIAYLTFWCDRLDDETATCTFVNTYVRKPSQKEIRQQVDKLDGADARAELTRDFPKCREKLGIDRIPQHRAELTVLNKRFYELLTGPCEQQNFEAFVAAFKTYTREVEGNTCTVSTSLPKSKTFKRKTANLWEGIDTAEPGMGGTVVMTIWREPKGLLWNYRQVQAGETDCTDSLYCREPGIFEWKYETMRPAMECRYVKND